MVIDDLQGRVIDDRYELFEKLGSGAMGVVYRARQRVVDREVAIKLMHRDVATHDDFRTRFEREAKALGKLDHPGCVRVYDFGWYEDLDAPFLVAQFIEGTPLYDFIGSLTLDEIFIVIEAIGEAMAHAHSHDVIHRDLKPENLLVAGGEITVDSLKVVDFGLARMSADEEFRLTKSGEAHGTPAYMSPEQCRGDFDMRPAVDVYALGCIAYELLESELPFTATSPSGVLIKHVTQPAPRIRRLDAPEALADLIHSMMAKDAGDRPSMEELVATVRELRSMLTASSDDQSSDDDQPGGEDTVNQEPVVAGPQQSGGAPGSDTPAASTEAEPDRDRAVTEFDHDVVGTGLKRNLWLLGAAVVLLLIGIAVAILISLPQAEQPLVETTKPDVPVRVADELVEQPAPPELAEPAVADALPVANDGPEASGEASGEAPANPATDTGDETDQTGDGSAKTTPVARKPRTDKPAKTAAPDSPQPHDAGDEPRPSVKLNY